MRTVIIIFAIPVFFLLRVQAQVVTDYDGNVYDTVVIENQVWLKQNLRTTHYNTGALIPNVTDSTAWATLLSGGRCYYNNDSSAYDSVYGPLYNWYAAHNSNVCPLGWRVPSDAEWQDVENILGGAPLAGGEMKEADTVHWLSPNTGATNNSGFTGLPGGGRTTTGTFQFIRENGLWWTSSSNGPSTAVGLYMWYLSSGVEHDPVSRKYGVSIRCMKDANNGIEDINDAGKCSLNPNPAKDIITLDFGENQRFIMQVFNIIGECVMEREFNNGKNSTDISSLPGGTYMVKLIGKTNVITKILLKNK
ncbi:MAG TPA: FISUMP domain-containing protein [Bacteroidales bacterium]|nr:FISUMP domain-containing protein [Bacteroidales bacterium]